MTTSLVKTLLEQQDFTTYLVLLNNANINSNKHSKNESSKRMQFVQNYKYIDLIRVKDWQFFSLLDALASFKD